MLAVASRAARTGSVSRELTAITVVSPLGAMRTFGW